MSEMSNEAIQAQLEANKVASAKVQIGEPITDATASKVVYSDASKNVAAGSLPFELQITGATDSTFSFLDLTGASSNSADIAMQGTLVDGAQVTTFTKTGFARVTITDSGGNITDGTHYIQFGTLS